MKLPNKVYDALKWIATIGLPALSTMFFTIGSIWGWSFTEQLIGSIAAICTFLGVVLGISTVQYNKNKNAESADK